MATKTVPAKKSTTTTKSTTTSDDAQEASITVIKRATSKNLNGSATLGYLIGLDATSALHWKIDSNSGNGMFSKEWVSFSDIQKALDKWPKELPITSMALRSLYQGKSVNTPSFLLATLVEEKILQQVPEKKRHYQLGDDKPFLSAMKELTGTDSKPVKPKPTVKAKAGARMPKGKAKPATGK